jgi:hypothetical protein
MVISSLESVVKKTRGCFNVQTLNQRSFCYSFVPSETNGVRRKIFIVITIQNKSREWGLPTYIL